jgi:hypothetical protein
MMFTYEWSDWRDGVFFWVQAVEVTDERAYGVMKNFLDHYSKNGMKYKWCGVRVSGLKSLHNENIKLVELFKL